MSFNLSNPELDEAKARIEALNREVEEKFSSEEFRNDIAQEIGDTVYEGFRHDNLVELFTEVERKDYNGRSFIKEVRGLKAFHMAPGGYVEESDLRADVMEIRRDEIGFHVRENTDVLASNFGETASTLVNLGIQRLDSAVNQRVLSTYQAAVPISSPYYIATSGLSLTQVNDAISAVEDSSVYAGKPTIIGRSTMVNKIVTALTNGNSYSLYLPETNEDLLRRGVIGSYRGVNVITLTNHLDEEGNSFFPANELWFIGRNAGKTAFFGGPKVKQFEEDDNWYWHYIYKMAYGVAVTRPDRVRRLVDGTVAP